MSIIPKFLICRIFQSRTSKSEINIRLEKSKIFIRTANHMQLRPIIPVTTQWINDFEFNFFSSDSISLKSCKNYNKTDEHISHISESCWALCGFLIPKINRSIVCKSIFIFVRLKIFNRIESTPQTACSMQCISNGLSLYKDP